MLDLYALQQLAAFAELGTLSRVARDFHVSTPSVTRTMQQLESSFAVPLFVRGKNKIELNDTGRYAAGVAQHLLREAEQALQSVRDYDQRQRTIVIRSCAPAPLWELQKSLNAQNPSAVVSWAICQNDEVLSAWQNASCDIAVLPFCFAGAKQLMQENLYVCVPPSHELARHSVLSWGAVNGFNFLLRTELGFWDSLCREKMPASKFLMQPDPALFDELVAASTLPCFATDYRSAPNVTGRICIPLEEPEAHVTFYAASRCRQYLVTPV